jgi:hypothetical protein
MNDTQRNVLRALLDAEGEPIEEALRDASDVAYGFGGDDVLRTMEAEGLIVLIEETQSTSELGNDIPLVQQSLVGVRLTEAGRTAVITLG